jgi:phosphate transport system substrate-binding protein
MTHGRGRAAPVHALMYCLCFWALLACRAGDGGPAAAGGSVRLTGAGASFPHALYARWIASYRQQDPKIEINYQAIGSGGGIRQLIEGTIDFGASDIPLSSEEEQRAPRKILQIPTALGAVAVAYNLPTAPDLQLGPELLAALFLGRIQRWNDARVAAENPSAELPDLPVSVVFRSDGSGTNAVFTEYLSQASLEFAREVGKGTNVTWPSGVGAAGNEGVTSTVQSTLGAVAYIESSIAQQSGLAVAALRNSSGAYVKPTAAAIARAAGSTPPELHGAVQPGDHAESYPIAAYTYLLVYEEYADFSKGRALARFLWWSLHEGQRLCAALHYVPLPSEVVRGVEARLKRLHSGSQQLLPDS